MEKKLFKKSELISIYTDANSDYFGLGKIISINDECLIIASVDPSGIEDGMILYCLDLITKFESCTQYINKIIKLMKKKQTKLCNHVFQNENIIFEFLELAKNNKKIIDIQLYDINECYSTGYIVALNREFCEIQQIDSYGQKDGLCKFSIDDIASIKYDNLENRDIELLMK